LRRPLRQRAGDHVRRWHEAIGVLMVLVDADAVEAQLIGVSERVDVLAIELMSLDRIVELVGEPDPGRVVALVEVVRQIGPGHQVEEVIAQADPRLAAMNRTASALALYGIGKTMATDERGTASGDGLLF